MPRSRPAVTAAVLLVALGPSPAAAQTPPRTLGRGLAGMTTAFLEVPGTMADQTRRRGPAEGIPPGFALGLGMIVPRVLVGASELASAPFPFPAGYRPVLEPEFPSDHFDGGSRRRR